MVTRREHVNHAFNPQVLERIDTSVLPHVDFSFSGQIVMETQFHRKREEIAARAGGKHNSSTLVGVSTTTVQKAPKYRGCIRLLMMGFRLFAAPGSP